MALAIAPTRELSVAAQVAADPLVAGFRKAIQNMHSRMVRRYGPDYACEVTPVDLRRFDVDSTALVMAQLDQEMTRMSPADAAAFERLHKAAASIRASVRDRILTAA